MSNQTKDSKTEAREKTSMTSNLLDYVGEKLDPRQEVPLDQRLAQLTPEQKAQLQEIEDNAIRTFKGMLDDLESALGMLRIGHHVGWKVLYMAHSKKTVRKYEEILNIRIRDIFPEKGPSADRSLGLALAEKYSNFWKVVSGEIKITNRREIK
jgi:hypothetical protein